jgi:hypothetical protein
MVNMFRLFVYALNPTKKRNRDREGGAGLEACGQLQAKGALAAEVVLKNIGPLSPPKRYLSG